MAFFNGFAPTASILGEISHLIRPGGMLVCANITLGGDGEETLADPAARHSYSLGETMLAVKR